MSKLGIVGITVAALGAFVLGVLFFGYIGFSNTANGFEVDIKAKYTDNKNVYDNGWKKIKEVAQVPDLQVEALQKVFKTALEARYGGNGSKAMMQWLTEQNPNLDQQTFLKIQQDIEGFRNEFQANQTRLVSLKQEYERFLKATTGGRLFNTLAGYPKIDLSLYDIVTSDKTEQDFTTKKAEPLKLR